MNNYTTPEYASRPNILDVISRYTPLRKRGKEHKGLCPFHDDRNPSFSVDEDRGVFYCFSCATGGDVFTFVELAEGVDFRGALQFLGMSGDSRPPSRLRDNSINQTAWARAQVERMNCRLRELGEMLEVADEAGDAELAESIWRERRLLADLRDGLRDPAFRQDFTEIRDVIEGITKGFE